MADDKKKPAPDSSPNYFDEIVFLLAGLLILSVILNQLVNYLNSLGWNVYDLNSDSILGGYFLSLWSFWKVIAVLVSAASMIWIAYSLRKLQEINEVEKKYYGSTLGESTLSELTEKPGTEKNKEKWARVKAHVHSDNPSDWRLAIIEADIMLDELLRKQGFIGDTVGDMLKAAEEGGLLNLEPAWEAHKIRNRIAHSGEDFQLTDREAKRAIALFETVFKEFEAI